MIQVMADAGVFLLIFFIAVKPATSEPPAGFFSWGHVSCGARSLSGERNQRVIAAVFGEELDFGIALPQDL